MDIDITVVWRVNTHSSVKQSTRPRQDNFEGGLIRLPVVTNPLARLRTCYIFNSFIYPIPSRGSRKTVPIQMKICTIIDIRGKELYD